MAAHSSPPSRQPIPPLAHTLSRCANTTAPFLNGLQRLKSRLFFAVYGASHASRQRSLIKQAVAQPHNRNPQATSVTELFLRSRYSLPFSTNYPLLLAPEAETSREPLDRAARLVVAAFSLYRDIQGQHLENDQEGDYELDMAQYLHCFATQRQPGPVQDRLVSARYSRHIAILVAGQIYSLSLDDHNLSIPAVRAALGRMIRSEQADADPGPGLLTTLPRDQWYQARHLLLANETNRHSLACLEKAFLVLCLDVDHSPESLASALARLQDGNLYNRYFDASVQLVVFGNAMAGLNIEHAALDEDVALGLAGRLQRRAECLTEVVTAEPQTSPSMRERRLDWVWTPVTRPLLHAARQQAAQAHRARALSTRSHTMPLVLRQQAGMDPQSGVLLALQLATTWHFGRPLNIFETVSTRRFAGGRLDYLPACNGDTPTLAHALSQGIEALPRAKRAFNAALVERRTRLRASHQGEGMISHLLALEATRPADKGLRLTGLPRLASLDKGLRLIQRPDVISAGATEPPGVAGIGTGMPFGNGIALGYVLQDDRIVVHLSATGRYRHHGQLLQNTLAQAFKALEHCA